MGNEAYLAFILLLVLSEHVLDLLSPSVHVLRLFKVLLEHEVHKDGVIQSLLVIFLPESSDYVASDAFFELRLRSFRKRIIEPVLTNHAEIERNGRIGKPLLQVVKRHWDVVYSPQNGPGLGKHDKVHVL